MKRKKLLKALTDLLSKEERKRREHREGLLVLLAKLEVKKIELEARIGREEGARKKERLGKELEIVQAQHAKGVEALRRLEES